MIEILTSGNVDNDFKRLKINPKLTYQGKDEMEYKVYEVSDKDFEILCNEPDIEGTWENCGWRHCIGNTKGAVNNILIVNGKELKCWYEEYFEEDLEELEEEFKPEYDDLLTYLCDGCGCSTFKNICALTVDLAKANNMKLSKLFKTYN